MYIFTVSVPSVVTSLFAVSIFSFKSKKSSILSLQSSEIEDGPKSLTSSSMKALLILFPPQEPPEALYKLCKIPFDEIFCTVISAVPPLKKNVIHVFL